MLITSREALRIQGEREFPLAPLPLPEDVHLLEESPAVQLFVQRAIAVQPDFQLTPENAPLVMEICRRLDGLPLALELAAARIRSLSLADMLAQFDRLFDWLTRGRRDSPAWRQTLLGAIEWSYSLLTDPERTLLARLAVFSGGWTLEAAEAVCSDERLLKKNRVVDLLSQLVDRSLVVSEPHLGRARYRFLDTIFHFSLSKLEESGKKEELRDRHLDYFSGWAEAAEARLETAPPLELRGQMDAEGNNIRAALEWGLSNKQQTETGLRLVCSAGSVWLKHSHFKEALAWAEKYLPLSNEHPNLKARLLFLATALSYWRDNLQQALTYGAEGAPLAKAVGAYDACAGILCYMGDALRESGQYEAARKNVEEAVALCREHFRPIRLSMALTSLGIIRYQMGERDFAETHIDEALEIAERENSLWAQSYALRVRADNLRFDGKFADSYRAYEEALSVSREIDDRISVGMELANLSLLANVLDDYSASANYARKALALFQSIGNEYQQPFPQRMLAYALTHEGDIQRARAACMESLNGNRAIGHRTGVIACLVCLASILYAEGNTSAAHGLLSTLQAEIAAHSVKLMEPDAKAFNHLVASLKVRAAPVEEKGGSLVEVLGELGL